MTPTDQQSDRLRHLRETVGAKYPFPWKWERRDFQNGPCDCEARTLECNAGPPVLLVNSQDSEGVTVDHWIEADPEVFEFIQLACNGAVELSSRAAEVAKLRSALEPFAALDTATVTDESLWTRWDISHAWVLAARSAIATAALAQPAGEGGEVITGTVWLNVYRDDGRVKVCPHDSKQEANTCATLPDRIGGKAHPVPFSICVPAVPAAKE